MIHDSNKICMRVADDVIKKPKYSLLVIFITVDNHLLQMIEQTEIGCLDYLAAQSIMQQKRLA